MHTDHLPPLPLPAHHRRSRPHPLIRSFRRCATLARPLAGLRTEGRGAGSLDERDDDERCSGIEGVGTEEPGEC
jgi:hypothetical protein